MTNVFPTSNLPTVSQPWGREVQKRVETLESQFSLQRTNSATIDAQLQASYRRLDETVIGLLQADLDIQAALAQANQGIADAAAAASAASSAASAASAAAATANSAATAASTASSQALSAANTANNAITGLTGLGSSGSAYSINADNINAGTLNANYINGGTITASSVDLTSGSYGIKVGSSGDSAYINCYVGSGDGTTFGMAGFSGSISGGSPTVTNTGWVAAFYPRFNGGPDLGTSGRRWNTVYATTATINTSDAREKRNIATSTLGLDFINQLNPVSYKRIDGIRTHYGLIAQEVEQVLNDNNISTQDFAGFIRGDVTDPDSILGLRYSEFISPIIKAIQELNNRIETLENGATNG